MKKICLLVPFYNYTVEYELQRYLTLGNTSYYIYKVPYNTSVSIDPLQFYDELLLGTNEIMKRLSKFEYERAYVLCASFIAYHGKEFVNTNSIIDLLVKYCKRNEKREIVLYSSYDRRIDENIVSILQGEKINVRKIVKVHLSGSQNYFEFGLHGLEDEIIRNQEGNVQNVVLCTNIPTLHLISNDRLNLVSTNYLLIDELKRSD